MTILYVEDDKDIAESISEVLQDLCDHLIVASNGKEGLEILQSGQAIDLLVTDINMPIMNGLELIENMKKIDLHIPSIVTSAYTDHNFFIKSIELKVDGYVLKPINIFELISQIEKIIKNILLTKKYKKSQKLLEEYKSIIDQSSIVSKANIHGVITYANQAFCTISGYTQEELIGKNHNIVRDPQTPSSVFKVLWENLTNKKPWRGILRNKKKNGEYYYVDSLIAPIINDFGEVEEYIGIRHDITQLELYKLDMEKELDKITKEIIDTQKEVVFTMGAIGETRSKETGLHVKRVAEYSYLLAKLYGLSEEEASLLKQASPMHDIGKVGIADSILNKPGKLDNDEFEIMKTHATLGYEMLKHSSREILKAASIVAHEHHEKWDGTGYPRGLIGKNIHIFGRITAIADVFDALGHDRVYKKAWELPKILALFQENKGKHFDPQLIEIFMDNLDLFLKVQQELSDESKRYNE